MTVTAELAFADSVRSPRKEALGLATATRPSSFISNTPTCRQCSEWPPGALQREPPGLPSLLTGRLAALHQKCLVVAESTLCNLGT